MFKHALLPVALFAFCLCGLSAASSNAQIIGTWKIVGMYQFESATALAKTDAANSFFALASDGTGTLTGPAYGKKGVSFTWTADPESRSFSMDTGDWYIEGYFVIQGDTLILAAGQPDANSYIYVLEKAPKK